MPVISFKNNKTDSINAKKSLGQLLMEATEEDTIQLHCDDYPIHPNIDPETEYGYWHIAIAKSASELEEAWKTLVAKVRDKKLWRVEVVVSSGAIGFKVLVPYYVDELTSRAALDHLKECLQLNSTKTASEIVVFGLNPNEAAKRWQEPVTTSHQSDLSDITLATFFQSQPDNLDARGVISFNIDTVANRLNKINKEQFALYQKLQQLKTALLSKLASPELQPEMVEPQLIEISKVIRDLTQLMGQFNLAIKQERDVHNAIFSLRRALITKLGNAVTGAAANQDFKKLGEYLEIAVLPVRLGQSLKKLNTGLADQCMLYNSLEALQAQLLSEAATAVSKGNVAEMRYLCSVLASADTLVNTLLDNKVLPGDKIDAIHRFETLAKVHTPIWQSIAKAAGAVIITAATCVVVAAACGALGFGIGFALGAWAGPGAMLAALAGLFKGTVTGAALGAAIGISATTALLGAATFGISTYSMFKPTIFQQESRRFAKAAAGMVPQAADEEQRPLIKSTIN